MNENDELKEVSAVFDQSAPNRAAYKFLKGLFGDNVTLNILKNVSKNIKLFRLFQTSNCEKFISVDNALLMLNKDTNTKQKVLIHFTELNLYGMFTPEEYTDFTNNLADKIFDGNNITFRPKQIILAGLPQKLVFICLGDVEIIEKIREYVNKKYKCAISHIKSGNRTEITVQGVGGNSYEESQKTYYDLFDYISKEQRSTMIAENVVPLPIIKCADQNYIAADISYDISKPQNLSDIISALKTIHGGNIVINMIVGNGNINGGYINDGNNKQDTNENVLKSLKWIRDNLPNEKEVTTAYYNRYVEKYDGVKITNSQVGKIVRSFGYKPVQGTQHRFWVKN